MISMIATLLRRGNWRVFVLALIVVLATVLRFYRAPERYVFLSDQARDALVISQAVAERQLPLTGPFSSLGQFTFGPWYYYLLFLGRAVIASDYSSWVVSGVTGVLSVLLIYGIGLLAGGARLGLVASFLAAISPWSVLTALDFSNATFVGFFSALAVLIYLKILKRPSICLFWCLLLGLVVGVGVNFHYQMVGLVLLLPMLALTRSTFWGVAAASVGLFLAFVPLLLFDLTNHWFNWRGVMDYILVGRHRIYVPNRWLFYALDFWPLVFSATFGLPKVLALAFFGATGVVFFGKLWQKTAGLGLRVLSLLFFLLFVALRYYSGERSLGYLFFFQALIFLAAATFLLSLLTGGTRRLFGLTILSLVVVFSLSKSVGTTNHSESNLAVRGEVAILKERFPEEKLRIYYCRTVYGAVERARMLVLGLILEGRYSETGRKIAYYANNDCPTKLVLLPGILARDLDGVAKDTIARDGWQEASPKEAFVVTFRWWFAEEP